MITDRRVVMAGLNPRRSVLLALAVIALCGVGGCGTARHIRGAQDSFNQAAAEENRLFAAGLSTEVGLLSQSSAAGDYGIALALLDRELDENEEELRRDRLYGTALMLKALTLWRLADLEGLNEPQLDPETPTGEQLLAESASPSGDELMATLALLRAELEGGRITLGERDRVLLVALPGLRDHDRGLRAPDYATARRFFESALEVMDRSLEVASTPEQHPVRIYVRLAQLSTCRAWQSAAFAHLGLGDAEDETNEHVLPRAEEILEELEKLAQRDSTLKEQIEELKLRLGLS